MLHAKIPWDKRGKVTGLVRDNCSIRQTISEAECYLCVSRKKVMLSVDLSLVEADVWLRDVYQTYMMALSRKQIYACSSRPDFVLS